MSNFENVPSKMTVLQPPQTYEAVFLKTEKLALRIVWFSAHDFSSKNPKS
jgi:hypothetical protein